MMAATHQDNKCLEQPIRHMAILADSLMPHGFRQ